MQFRGSVTTGADRQDDLERDRRRARPASAPVRPTGSSGDPHVFFYFTPDGRHWSRGRPSLGRAMLDWQDGEMTSGSRRSLGRTPRSASPESAAANSGRTRLHGRRPHSSADQSLPGRARRSGRGPFAVAVDDRHRAGSLLGASSNRPLLRSNWSESPEADGDVSPLRDPASISAQRPRQRPHGALVRRAALFGLPRVRGRDVGGNEGSGRDSLPTRCGALRAASASALGQVAIGACASWEPRVARRGDR
jgi:hypothetical protein